MANTSMVVGEARDTSSIMERVLVVGDLSKLSAQERTEYYAKVCESVGLNPLTRPFGYLNLNGKTTLYCLKDATEQLRKIHGVSIRIVSRETTNDCYVIVAQATDKYGRVDEAIGAVPLKGLAGEALANAYMKCETKAKRRVTLSIVGLGWLDESEVSSIAGAHVVPADDLVDDMAKSASDIESFTSQVLGYTTMDGLKSFIIGFNNDLKAGRIAKYLREPVAAAYSRRKAELEVDAAQ